MSSADPYCPDVGDAIWIDFDPQAGREQAGQRPALVLSSVAYNRLTQLCVLCPITSQTKGYPFEVRLPAGLEVKGAVLSDHVKSLSWMRRRSKFLCRVPADVTAEVRAKLAPLLGFGR